MVTAVPLGLPGSAGTAPDLLTPATEVQAAGVSTLTLTAYPVAGAASLVSTARTWCLVASCSCCLCTALTYEAWLAACAAKGVPAATAANRPASRQVSRRSVPRRSGLRSGHAPRTARYSQHP